MDVSAEGLTKYLANDESDVLVLAGNHDVLPEETRTVDETGSGELTTIRPESECVASTWPILICVLGDFRLLKRGRSVHVRRAGKTQSLLTMLSLRPGYCASRDFLVEALWPTNEESLSQHSLTMLVHSLRKSLGDAIGGAAPVLNTADGYRFNTEMGVAVDLACFDALASQGDRAARSRNMLAAATAYQQAVGLYRGDMCVEIDSAAIVERERVRTRYLSLLAHLADYCYSEHRYEECLAFAAALLRADPCREDGHRTVMRCHVRLGQRAQAWRQYHLCQAILHDEFGAPPEPLTKALFEQVRLSPESI
jgi:DNA-binding SARP family transcriptional activator